MRRATFCGHARESACRSEIGQVTPVLEEVGAGEGNRTLVISLEGWMIAKRIKGIAAKPHASAPNGINWLRLFCKTLTDTTETSSSSGTSVPQCPKPSDAVLRLGRERLVSARPSQAEPAADFMAALVRVPRAAAGTAITPTENGPPRPLRSEDGCGRWSGTLQKRQSPK
jgi:hypothetical protein